MPDKPNKVTQRWNPGSASAALAAAASSSNSTTLVKNPSAKKDTFVSEGSVKDRLSIWNAGKEKETQTNVGGKSRNARKQFPVESTKPTNPAAAPISIAPVDTPASLPSSSSHSTSSRKSTNPLPSASAQSTGSVESLTGASSHRDRLAAYGKATQSMSRLSGHGVVVPQKVSTTKSSYLGKDSKKSAATASAKANRASLMANSRIYQSMSSIKATQVPSSSSNVPNDMPVGGKSVKDRLMSWGKAPATTASDVERSTTKGSAYQTQATGVVDPPVQPSESIDTQESLSKKSTETNEDSAASSDASITNKQPSWKSPPPAYANRTLKKITPPQEDRHKHQNLTPSTGPSVGLKKVAQPVEDKHKLQKEQFTGSMLPTVGLKKVALPVETEKKSQAKNTGRPSLYSATSLRNVGKPKEDKWKENLTSEGRPSSYSSISLRSIEKPKEGPPKVEEEASMFPPVALKSVRAPKEDKSKVETQQNISGEGMASSTSPLYSSATLRSIPTQAAARKEDSTSHPHPHIYSPTKLRNVDMPKEDKWKDLKNIINDKSTSTDVIDAGVNFDPSFAHTATSSAASSPSANPDMPTGEKTKEMSTTNSPALINPAAITPPQNVEEEKTHSTSAELTLEDLPLESPANGPMVPPSPLEILVKENVKGGKNKLLMLMSSMSGRQDQKTAQDRALTILKGLQVGPDEMELVDGADPLNRERRNELFALSGVRAQYPQFFLVDDQGKTEFLGDWDSFEMMHDSGHLGESMNLGGFQEDLEAKHDSMVNSMSNLEMLASSDMRWVPAKGAAMVKTIEHLKNLNIPEAKRQDDTTLDDDNIFDFPKKDCPDKPLLTAALNAKEQTDHAKQITIEGNDDDQGFSEFSGEDDTNAQLITSKWYQVSDVASQGKATTEPRKKRTPNDPLKAVGQDIPKDDENPNESVPEIKLDSGHESDIDEVGAQDIRPAKNATLPQEAEVYANVSATSEDTEVEHLPTPRKSGSRRNENDDEGTMNSMSALSHLDKQPATILGEYFERSYSSRSSEASEGGWSEVHDQSESSDTGHSVQTHGTLGSANIVDATIQTQKIAPNDWKKASVAVKQMNLPKHVSANKHGDTAGRPPRKKSSTPKKTNKKMASYNLADSNDAHLQSPASAKKKKGKRGDYTKGIVPGAAITDVVDHPNNDSKKSTDEDEDRAERTKVSKKKSKKKKISLTESSNGNSPRKSEPKDKSDDGNVEPSPSKKKKKKAEPVADETTSTEATNICEGSGTKVTESPSKKKKKTKSPSIAVADED